MDINIKELLGYLDNKLKVNRKKELDRYFLANPEYFKILRGLELLRQELGQDDKIESHLAQAKEEMLDQLKG